MEKQLDIIILDDGETRLHIDLVIKFESRGIIQTATCRRMRERDSKHPCDQFAQDDIEMREAVLEFSYSSLMYH